jgi:hypothetical protein
MGLSIEQALSRKQVGGVPTAFFPHSPCARPESALRWRDFLHRERAEFDLNHRDLVYGEMTPIAVLAPDPVIQRHWPRVFLPSVNEPQFDVRPATCNVAIPAINNLTFLHHDLVHESVLPDVCHEFVQAVAGHHWEQSAGRVNRMSHSDGGSAFVASLASA